jgi:hypothetical protein
VFYSYEVAITTLSAEGRWQPTRSARLQERLAGVKKGEKRGTTKTTRNDYVGAGNETRMEMDKGRGRLLGSHMMKIAQMFEKVKGGFFETTLSLV